MLMLLALVGCGNDDFSDIEAVEPGEEVEVVEVVEDVEAVEDKGVLADLWNYLFGDGPEVVVVEEDSDSGSIDFDEPLPIACLGTTADLLEVTSPYTYRGTQYMTVFGSSDWTEDGGETSIWMAKGDELQFRLHDVTCDDEDSLAIITDDGLVAYDGRCLMGFIGYASLNLDCEAEIEVTECEDATLTMVVTTTVNGEEVSEMRHVERCELLDEWPTHEAPCED